MRDLRNSEHFVLNARPGIKVSLVCFLVFAAGINSGTNLVWQQDCVEGEDLLVLRGIWYTSEREDLGILGEDRHRFSIILRRRTLLAPPQIHAHCTSLPKQERFECMELCK